LNILDLATRECLAIAVDTSLPGLRVLRVLDPLIGWYGVPKPITLDNGPAFAGRALDAGALDAGALDAGAYDHQVVLDLIEPGKPTQKGHLESVNGKFRDECPMCLNLPWFTSLHHARHIIAAWKEDYNTQRPHSPLHQQPPAIYAQTLFA
jgi:putative transposase